MNFRQPNSLLQVFAVGKLIALMKFFKRAPGIRVGGMGVSPINNVRATE